MANPYFNAAYYLAQNPDVAAAGVDAEAHYREFGAREAFVDGAATRAPAPWFDIQYYLAQNPDVLAAVAGNVAAAFDHFTQHGIGEGRAPSADYDFSDAQWSDYAAANADLLTAFGITDPDNMTDAQQAALANHYFQYGYAENRDADPILPTEGETHTLTVEPDNFTAGDLGDTFDASLGRDKATGLISQETLNSDDVLTGGAGRDVLNAQLNGIDTLGGTLEPTINGIEEYNFTVAQANWDGGLSLFRSSGYDTINNVRSRGDLHVVDVSAAAGAPTIGLFDVRGDTQIEYLDDTTTIGEQDVVADMVGRANDPVQLIIGNDPGSWHAGLDIETLNLQVSRGVYLDLADAAGDVDNLNISGTDAAVLSNAHDFRSLVNLDAGEHDGGLRIDVSGSSVLESVVTGAGDDRVVVNRSAVDGDLTVDMGDGADILAIRGAWNQGRISNLDFTGGVENVETLELINGITLGADAGLHLAGFDDALDTIQLDNVYRGNGNTLTISDSPVDLTINALDHIHDMVLSLDAETLVLNGDGLVDIDDVSGANLRSLDVNQTQQAGAPGWMNQAWVDLDDSDGSLQNLEHVGVTSEGDASVELTGDSGTAEVAGVQQVEQYTVTGLGSGFAGRNGTVTFNSSSLDTGLLTVSYSTGGVARDADAATDIAAGLSGSVNPFTATSSLFSNQVTLTWDEFGPQQGLAFHNSTVNSGSAPTVATTVITVGVEHEDMIPGSGFEALEDVVVDAARDADVDLTDVYGDFTVDVTAGRDADVHLFNTNATSVSVDAAEYIHLDVDGDTIGNNALVDIAVSAEEADIDLAFELHSFTTLDLTEVSYQFTVDASAADFEPGALGNYVSYVIGATSASDATDFSSIDMAAAREAVQFTDGGFGTVVLDGFSTGNDPYTGDRVDLSELGFTNNGQLVFETGAFNIGTGDWTQGSGAGFNDVRITDLAGGPSFDGEIILTGIAANIDDLQAYNMLYA